MSLSAPGFVPPGWYPDPGGGRQWRAWNGTTWSDLTRPYGAATTTSTPGDSLALVQALDRLVRYGVGAIFAGLGLVVSVLAHWPGTAQPVPTWFAITFSNAGVAMLFMGSVLFAFAARALDGRWSAGALVPGLNVVVVAGLVHHRLSGRSPWRRVATETLLLAFFVTQSHLHPWLGVIPMVVALEHLVSTRALLEQVCGPPASANSSTSS